MNFKDYSKKTPYLYMTLSTAYNFLMQDYINNSYILNTIRRFLRKSRFMKY
jgi:hypothetical protein